MMTMEVLGGMAAPSPPLPAITVALRVGDQPDRTIHGPVNAPVAAVLPELDPDSAPIAADPAVSTSAGPPRTRPTTELRISSRRWMTPVRSTTYAMKTKAMAAYS